MGRGGRGASRAVPYARGTRRRRDPHQVYVSPSAGWAALCFARGGPRGAAVGAADAKDRPGSHSARGSPRRTGRQATMAEPPACAPPASLLKHDEPLFVGFDGADSAAKPGTAAGGQLGEMVNSMLPPRVWTEPTGTWMQYVSKAPASRTDVIAMQEALDAKLLERQARDAGICPVREDLYAQCFDELIRQLTLDGPERGLLLLRVRDEVRMTVDAYKVLYDSSVTFGVRKQLQAEQGMAELQGRVAELEAENKDLENRVLELRNGVEVVEKRASEHRPTTRSARARRLSSTRASTRPVLRQLGPAAVRRLGFIFVAGSSGPGVVGPGV